MNKKRISIIISLFLLLFPFASINAEYKITLDDLKKSWDGYYCYVLANGENPGTSKYIPTFTYREYAAYTGGLNLNKNENPMCLPGAHKNDGNTYTYTLIGGGVYYPIFNEVNCEINLFELLQSNSSRDYHHGGGKTYAYKDWKKKSVSIQDAYSNYPLDCMAAATVIGDALEEKDAQMQKKMYIEVVKNSDVYDDTDMENMKKFDPDFNDDTNFCFIHNGGGGTSSTDYSKGMVYYGHPFIYIDFSIISEGDETIVGKDEKYKRTVFTFEKQDEKGEFIDGIRILHFPVTHDNYADLADESQDVSVPVSIEKSALGDLNDHNFVDSSTYILTNNGKLITDPQECLGAAAEWTKELYSGTGISDDDAEKIAKRSGYVDSTIQDEDRIRVMYNFDNLLERGYSKEEAIDECTFIQKHMDQKNINSTGKPVCYRYLHPEKGGRPLYYTTVWTNQTLSCGFTLDSSSSRATCANGRADITLKVCGSPRENGSKSCQRISNSGYNGVADFYQKEKDESAELIQCYNFSSFRFTYRMITLLAPIITIFFVTFDLIRSIISGDEKKMSKFRESLVKRLIALTILLVLPALVYLMVSIFSKNRVIKNTSLIHYIVTGRCGGKDLDE